MCEDLDNIKFGFVEVDFLVFCDVKVNVVSCWIVIDWWIVIVCEDVKGVVENM